MIYDAVHQAVLLHEKHGTWLLELAAPLSCRRPMSGSSSFRRCGRSFTDIEIQARHNEKGRMTHCPKTVLGGYGGDAGE